MPRTRRPLRSTHHRRTAADWSTILESQRRSGLDVDAFAAREGLVAARLRWWRWRLGKSTEATASRRGSKAPDLRLVPLRLEDPSRSPGALALELVTPDGHQLRVFAAAELELVRQALVTFMGHR